MNHKHTPYPPTPAPWRVEERDSEILRDGKPVRYYSVAHASEKRDMFVALDVAPTEIFFSVTGATSPNLEGLANARLIAAAPDLLAALEIALATIERLTVQHGPFSSTQGTQDVIRAALAKASLSAIKTTK